MITILFHTACSWWTVRHLMKRTNAVIKQDFASYNSLSRIAPHSQLCTVWQCHRQLIVVVDCGLHDLSFGHWLCYCLMSVRCFIRLSSERRGLFILDIFLHHASGLSSLKLGGMKSLAWWSFVSIESCSRILWMRRLSQLSSMWPSEPLMLASS